MSAKKRIRRDPKAAREYWSGKVSLFRKSGLTQREFAKLHGLSVYSLRDWLQRFRELEKIPQQAEENSEAKPTLFKVRLVEKAKVSESIQDLEIEIKTPTGFVVGMHGLSMAQAMDVIRGLS